MFFIFMRLLLACGCSSDPQGHSGARRCRGLHDPGRTGGLAGLPAAGGRVCPALVLSRLGFAFGVPMHPIKSVCVLKAEGVAAREPNLRQPEDSRSLR